MEGDEEVRSIGGESCLLGVGPSFLPECQDLRGLTNRERHEIAIPSTNRATFTTGVIKRS